MNLFAAVILAQVGAAEQSVRPVLAFPEPGVDDTVAYEGYRTRFLRDAAGNAVQVYIQQREGRVVHLWADTRPSRVGVDPVGIDYIDARFTPQRSQGERRGVRPPASSPPHRRQQHGRGTGPGAPVPTARWRGPAIDLNRRPLV
jgi:hypothetical protein